MRLKMFITLFFDKARFIVLFLILVSASGYLILKQVDSTGTEPEMIELPDVEIMGSQTGEYPDTDISYAGIDDFILKLEGMINADTKIYRVTAKELYSFANPFYQVSFRIYGVEKDFFERFKGRLAVGNLPHGEMKEVLVGGNAASYYELKVGDVISDKTDIDIGIGEETYVVSGILEEKDRYYGNGFYVSKEHFQNSGSASENNMVMIYASDNQRYKELDDSIDEIKSDYQLGSYTDNHNRKNRERNAKIRNMLMTFAVSFLILELVYMYISKGMEKKVGIIKALGIPDSRMLTISAVGFGVLIVFASAIMSGLAVIMLNIKADQLVKLILEIGVALYFILFAEIIVKYKRIKPGASTVSA